MPPASPPSPQAAPAPVFVDDTGRRHRIVRLIGWVAGGLTLAYLALLGVSLIGSPGLVPLSLPAIGRVLPGPSAPQIGTALKYGAGGGAPLSPAEPAASAGHTRTVAAGTGASLPRGSAAGPRPAAAPTPRRTPSATPTPSAATPTHTPQGNPSPAGTPRNSHSPAAHRSPKNTHGSPHNVKGSPTPTPSPT